MVNLESFKLSKNQMNQISGGKVHCMSYNRKTGVSNSRDFDKESVEEAREEVIKEAVEQRAPVNVICWED